MFLKKVHAPGRWALGLLWGSMSIHTVPVQLYIQARQLHIIDIVILMSSLKTGGPGGSRVGVRTVLDLGQDSSLNTQDLKTVRHALPRGLVSSPLHAERSLYTHSNSCLKKHYMLYAAAPPWSWTPNHENRLKSHIARRSRQRSERRHLASRHRILNPESNIHPMIQPDPRVAGLSATRSSRS